ncbi:MAG TPA: hypothetical protein VHM27_16085 [Rhizomicrobium sp.]|nr:hypothetical protein [Rhizomicrobium sp.]
MKEAAIQLLSSMSWPVIAAWFVGTIAAISANLISVNMIGKINDQSPQHKKISYVFWGGEVRSRFKQLFPESKLVLLLDACVVAVALSFCALMVFS